MYGKTIFTFNKHEVNTEEIILIFFSYIVFFFLM